ncbi:hypothetical protein V1514DRAFT_332721 [Lipomyces japonicus]|uniref:uncharacterized protein n=1 Tax=Lipomyces japonicus TaxID=56871 RepID=UPI0034CEBBF2
MGFRDRLLFFYLFSVAVISFAIALTITAIVTPHWLSARLYPVDDTGQSVKITYGLVQKCSTITNECTPFPMEECTTGDREFCNIWRTTSFMMWLSLVLLGPAVISYATLILSNRQTRETGWRLIGLLLFLIVIVQVVAVSAVVNLLRTDANLQNGNWHIGISWVAATGSVVVVLGLLISTIVIGCKTVPEYVPIREAVRSSLATDSVA